MAETGRVETRRTRNTPGHESEPATALGTISITSTAPLTT